MDSVEHAAALVALADEKLVGSGEPGDSSQHLPRILSVGDVFAYRDPSYLIQSVIPEGALILLDAFTGTGKSLVSLELALSITDGFPFLGRFEVNRTGRVLLFDEETPEPYLKDRLRRMGFSPASPLSVVHFSGLKLDDYQGYEMIRRVVEHVEPVVTIFDSLIRFHTANEDSSQEMSLVMERLRAIVQMGTTVWAQHHLNKGDGDLRKRSRGSSDIPGAVDLELALIPHDDLLTLQSVKSRAAPVPPCELKIIAEEEQLHVVYQSETGGKSAAEGAVRELLSTRALSVGEIRGGTPSGGHGHQPAVYPEDLGGLQRRLGHIHRQPREEDLQHRKPFRCAGAHDLRKICAYVRATRSATCAAAPLIGGLRTCAGAVGSRRGNQSRCARRLRT